MLEIIQNLWANEGLDALILFSLVGFVLAVALMPNTESYQFGHTLEERKACVRVFWEIVGYIYVAIFCVWLLYNMSKGT